MVERDWCAPTWTLASTSGGLETQAKRRMSFCFFYVYFGIEMAKNWTFGMNDETWIILSLFEFWINHLVDWWSFFWFRLFIKIKLVEGQPESFDGHWRSCCQNICLKINVLFGGQPDINPGTLNGTHVYGMKQWTSNVEGFPYPIGSMGGWYIYIHFP